MPDSLQCLLHRVRLNRQRITVDAKPTQQTDRNPAMTDTATIVNTFGRRQRHATHTRYGKPPCSRLTPSPRTADFGQGQIIGRTYRCLKAKFTA